MILHKRTTVALAVLLAGCSGELGAPDAPPEPSNGPGGPGQTNEPSETRTVNDDGTITVTKADGSTETLDMAGNVIDSTPPLTQSPTGDASDPTKPSEGITSAPSRCEPGTPKSSQIPRITNRQYDNTVLDLLGVDLQLAASTLQADSKGNMDARTWQSYLDAAKAIAAEITTNPTAQAAAITCTTEDAACAKQVITEFGAKVFRRPLTDEEIARYEGLYSDSGSSFEERMAPVFQALFQSPYFLTIAELSEDPSTDEAGAERFALSDYELASRLSYMLWDTMPDGPLLTAAANGELTVGNGLAEQASRMLSDERAKGLVERLHMDYMRMGANTRWTGYARDAAKYPAYSPTQIDALAQETLLVADDVIFGGGSFAELMTTTTGYVNADTAALYGLDPSDYGAELTKAELGEGRPGLLTRAGFLAANSYGNRTSPIHRGAFIMKDVLCTPMGDPSPNAASTPLPNDPSLVTNRQKTDAQTSIGPECIGCHQGVINPAGFALEAFDAVGGVQTTDNGAPIETQADVIVGSQVVHVAGAQDLMTAIAAAPEAQRCYTENWVQVAYNRVLSDQDACTVDQIATKLADPAYSVTSLIADLATVESFRYRAHETEVTQ